MSDLSIYKRKFILKLSYQNINTSVTLSNFRSKSSKSVSKVIVDIDVDVEDDGSLKLNPNNQTRNVVYNCILQARLLDTNGILSKQPGRRLFYGIH
jgi:hypothetical protein